MVSDRALASRFLSKNYEYNCKGTLNRLQEARRTIMTHASVRYGTCTMYIRDPPTSLHVTVRC